MLIEPIGRPLTGTVNVPGSKSLTARALVVAVLADGVTRLTGASLGEDSRHFAGALRTLGFDVRVDATRAEILVSGCGGSIPTHTGALFVGNAGTAARFLTALLTLGDGEWEVDGDARMRERPIGHLVDALGQLGARVDATGGCPPVRVVGSGLRGGSARVDGSVSSQFISALLMVAPYADRPVALDVSGTLRSRPYVDMTMTVMRAFGVDVTRIGDRAFTVSPARYHSPGTYPIEPDASAASYFFAAAAICGGHVIVRGISITSHQGDVGFLECLQSMGCTVTAVDDGVRVGRGERLHGIDVDMRDIPDTAQTLAAIAPFACTPTRIRGIETARVKETDRIAATCAELARLGVEVEEHADGMTILPCARLMPARVRTYGDHRMAMAFALIGLRAPGVEIENPQCVSKTFPDFFEVLETLR
jgi:3-phosphoshikimate 1-carboxyvinyltransferase